MSIADAVAQIKVDHDPRITRVGAFIRRTSLDELPQLWNVVRGEMSLVGPRPLRVFEVDALDGWKLTRQLERPGMTGLWQVSGRSAVKWGERMQLDYTYVRHWSLGQDLEILARTVPAVIAGDGAK
jgi:lipopolysaccharide/colanic/teichoic acid biosynthesis glycosyltransferase